MRLRTTFRAALLALTSTGVLLSVPALPAQQRSLPHLLAPRAAGRPPGGARPKQEHLAQWLERHQNLPLSAQHQALESEPGFHDLPAQTQQRMHERIAQLNAMTPERRRRILERNEAMESLAPQQRQQVRSAMQQLAALPEDRRRLVARAFRDLRDVPAEQRQSLLNSDRYANLSEQERSTLSGLVAVEPLLPLQHPAEAPNQ